MDEIQTIKSHFPNLTESQLNTYQQYIKVFGEINAQINLVSRKDMEFFFTRHLLHSLSIAKAISFTPGLKVADVGTGGGLPGIPLAIMFPDVQFTLIDSIGKKIKAVDSMVSELKLKNVKTLNARMEAVKDRYDFIVSRGVKSLPVMHQWLDGKIRKGNSCETPNGLVYIKGGDFQNELEEIGCNYRYWFLDEWFDDPFFETKKVVWINMAR